MRILFLLVINCFTISIGRCAEKTNTALQEKIFAGWTELEKNDHAIAAINVVAERSELLGPNKGNNRATTSHYRRRDKTARITSESGRFDEIVLNSNYVFMVARESENQPWSMKFVELDLASEQARKLQENTFLPRIVAPTSAVLLGPFGKQQKKLSSLAEDIKFKIIECTKLQDGLVRIDYQHDLIVGELDCDPASHFVIKRGQSRQKDSSLEYTMSHERHFGQTGLDGRFNVEQLIYEVADHTGSRHKVKTSYSYPDVRKTGELDEERFRLTAYGLPEPEGVVWKKPRRWLPYWLAGGGLLIILLTTWWLRRARRVRLEEKLP